MGMTNSSLSKLSVDQLKLLDQNVVWHSFSQMQGYQPLIIERADGCWLYDIDGRKLLDGVSNMWCNVHGHNHPHINQALRDQIDNVAHITTLGLSHPNTIRLAQNLVEITPAGLNHVFFSSDGASAVEVALKMAFQHWCQQSNPQTSRRKFAALGNAYHGDTIGSVSVGGIEHFHQKFDPLLFECVRLPGPNIYRTELDPANATEFFAQRYREILKQHQNELAALIVEPIIQGAAGMIVHPPGLLHQLREITRELGILLIADEVAVGFGRTGQMFACEVEDVEPDIMCLGKGLTGGYLPMSATVASTEIWNSFLGDHGEAKTLFHGHTYSGNPLCAAAAIASLELFELEDTLNRLKPKIEYFQRRLNDLLDVKQVGDIRKFGFVAGVELVQDKTTHEPFDWTTHRGRNVCQRALENGVWLRPLGDVIVLMPPFCVDQAEIDLLIDTAKSAIEAEFEAET